MFLNQVGSHFKEKTYLGRINKQTTQKQPYKVDASPNDFIEIPFYSSLKHFISSNIKNVFQLVKTINRAIKKSDILWLAWPHPISSLIILLQIGKGKKVILNVRCDLAKLVSIRYSGVSRFLGLGFISFSNQLLKWFFKDVQVLVTGSELKAMYSEFLPNTHAIKNTIISRDDCFLPERELSGSVHLLSVGRLEPEKGIEYLLKAIPLIKKKYPLKLSIVGNGQNEAKLKSLSKDLGITDSVSFHGYVPFGEDLFRHYVYSDILVLPSLSEGLPRVVNEVRGFGLPIVSTHVGGLKTELQDQQNCLKVEVQSPEDISKKVIALIEHENLYERISANLYGESLTNTIEYQSANVISKIISRYD
jgi:glycosyltransferase involved in cell wall biosynthesis